jgi:hypothetical protein
MSGDAIRDEDIYAFNPVPPPPPRPPRRVWPWVLAGFVALAVLMAISGATAMAALIDGARDGVHVVIDGDEWAGGHLSVGHGLLAGMGVMLALSAALLVLLVVVPLVLAVALCAVALGVGVALLAVALVVAAATSPLWGLVLLLWLALRPRRTAPARMPA